LQALQGLPVYSKNRQRMFDSGGVSYKLSKGRTCGALRDSKIYFYEHVAAEGTQPQRIEVTAVQLCPDNR